MSGDKDKRIGDTLHLKNMTKERSLKNYIYSYHVQMKQVF